VFYGGDVEGVSVVVEAEPVSLICSRQLLKAIDGGIVAQDAGYADSVKQQKADDFFAKLRDKNGSKQSEEVPLSRCVSEPLPMVDSSRIGDTLRRSGSCSKMSHASAIRATIRA
jgi:hypothetical protein